MFSGAWMVTDASVSAASRQVGGREAVEVLVARRGPPALALAGQRRAQQRPRAAAEDLRLEREQQRRGERRGADDDLLPGPHLEAVVREQAREAGGVDAHGASSSGNHSARCVRSTSRIQWRSSAVAKR